MVVWYCQICNTNYTGAKANCLCSGPNYESSYIAAEAKKVDEAMKAMQKGLTKAAYTPQWIGDPNIPDDGRMYGYNIAEIQAAAKKYNAKDVKVFVGGVECTPFLEDTWTLPEKSKECDCYDRACHDGHAPWCATRGK